MAPQGPNKRIDRQRTPRLAGWVTHSMQRGGRYIAAWVGQAGDKAKADRIRHHSNDRDSGRQWFEKLHPAVRDRKNHVRLRAKHITCRLHRRSLDGISLHDQVASLDIPEPTKFAEKRSPEWKTAGFSGFRYR